MAIRSYRSRSPVPATSPRHLLSPARRDSRQRRHRTGDIRIAVDFQQPLVERQLKGYPLPLVQAEEVEFQSAFVSLEGSPELEVTPSTAHRTVDEAELYQARYLVDQPAAADKRLIGAYGYSGREGSIKVNVVRRAQHVLPSAIVQRAELVTKVSANGLTQTEAS